MKYLGFTEARKAKRHGDIVWAIKDNGTEQPICVMLTTFATKDECESATSDSYTNYMHAYNPAAKDVNWKEWLNPNFYAFADTEDEAIAIYNQKLQRSIDELRGNANKLTAKLIPVSDDMKPPTCHAVNRYSYSTRFITNLNEISRLYHRLPVSIASEEQKEEFLKHYNAMDFREVERMVKAAIELQAELTITPEFMHDTITDTIMAILSRRIRDCQEEILSDVYVKLQYVEINLQLNNDVDLALHVLRIQADLESGRIESALKRLNRFKKKLSDMGQDTCDDRNIYTHTNFCLDAMARIDI